MGVALCEIVLAQEGGWSGSWKGARNPPDPVFYEENRQKAPHFSGGMNAVLQ